MSLEITVRNGIAKTKVTRTVPISPFTATHLQKLLKARFKNWGNTIPLFCSYEGKLMLESSWGHRLKKYSQQIDHSITSCSLRHSFALSTKRWECLRSAVDHGLS